MRKLSFFMLLFLVGFSTTVLAQPATSTYSKAAQAYLQGDFLEAEKLWIQLADQGDANSQYALSIMHLKKEAKNSEDAVAFKYLVEAAKQQHVPSMFNLGVAYWEGRGVSRQPEKALNWWEWAAEQEDPGAQFNLGLAYYTGQGRAQSTKSAIHWLQRAADNGHKQAQALLPKLQGKKDEPPVVDASVNEPKPKPREEVLKPAPTKKQAPPQQAAGAVSTIDDVAMRTVKRLTMLKAAPDENSARIIILKPETKVRLISDEGNWSKVQVDNSYPVWVHESLVADLGEGRGTIQGDNVNIRPSASTDNRTSPPLGQLNTGDPVSIVLKRSPWLKVVPSTPFPAWVVSADIEQ